MAYDPEARQQSNSAMTIGIVALVIMVIGALAYYSTTNSRAENTPVITHTERTIVETPANPPAPVVVHEPSAPVVVHDAAPPVVVHDNAPPKVIERNNTIIRERTPVIQTPPASSGDTNVTVNMPPAAEPTAVPSADSGTSSSP